MNALAPPPVPIAGAAAPDPLYRALFDAHPDPTFTLDRDGRLLEVNRAFAAFVGEDAAALHGRPLAALLDGDAARAALGQAVARAARGASPSWQTEFRGPDDSVGLAFVSLAPVVADGAVMALHGVARDVTVYRVMEEQLHARVFVDPLTGLPNRTRLHERVERALRVGAPTRVAVLTVDLDDFKLVNDGLGRAAGDALLREVADRLRRATRGGDLVARLGADEFAVLLDGLAAPADATIVVGRIFAALDAAVHVDGHAVRVSASVGVAHADADTNAGELLRQADLAVYTAKAHGKARHVVYDPAMQSAARDRLELANDLRAALAAEAVDAAFQPIVDLESGAVVKVEALARWTHPTRGAISPAVFIPLAEEMGLIESLGALMLRRACALAAERRAAGRPLGVTVNVSGRQIERGSLVATLRAVLAETGARPDDVTLELTESVAMRHADRVLRTLDEIAALGVGLAIDDFGTGYSSLAYLHRFPVDVLKIDRSFVEGIADDPQAVTLARTIVGVARSLGLRTMAEGIETEAQRAVLRDMGCEMGQGWLFGRPVAAERLVAP